ERASFAPKLLVTRRLDPMYNVECVLRAFHAVQARYPEASLTVAGEGSEEQRLRAMVAQWAIPNVTFSGNVQHADLPALYPRHDIAVHSSNVDNFPGALVEAASCGLPIVTTRAGGIQQMIRDGHNGLLVDLNDDAALAARVISIIENPALGRSLAFEA